MQMIKFHTNAINSKSTQWISISEISEVDLKWFHFFCVS